MATSCTPPRKKATTRIKKAGTQLENSDTNDEPDNRQGRRHEPDVEDRSERCRREVEYPVSCEAKKTRYRIFGNASHALATVIWQRNLLIPDPCPEAAPEPNSFRQGVDGLDHLSIHQTKIPAVHRDVDLGEAAEEAIEHEVAEPDQRRLFPPFAHGINDRCALLPPINHLEHRRRRVLQIGIGDNHRIAGGVTQAGTDGGLLPEIARETDNRHTWVVVDDASEQFSRAVSAAIIDKHKFERDIAASFERSAQSPIEGIERFLFVETRYDH